MNITRNFFPNKLEIKIETFKSKRSCTLKLLCDIKSKPFGSKSFSLHHSDHSFNFIPQSISLFTFTLCINSYTLTIHKPAPPTVNKSNALATFVFQAWCCVSNSMRANILTRTGTRARTDWMPVFFLPLLSYRFIRKRSKRNETWMIRDQYSTERSTEHTSYIHYSVQMNK